MRKRKIISTVFLSSVLLSACGSQYNNEDEKLETYSLELEKAVDYYAVKSNVIRSEDEINTRMFAQLEPYVDAFKSDINTDELSNDSKVFYEDALRGIKDIDGAIEASKDNVGNAVESYYSNMFDDDDTVMLIRRHYNPGRLDTEKPQSIKEFTE